MLAAYPFHQLVTCTFPILFWWETLQPTTSARETQVVLCLSISYTYSCIILGAGYFIMVSNVNHVTSNGIQSTWNHFQKPVTYYITIFFSQL